METMLFNYETTYKTSYKGNRIKPPIFTLYKKKPETKRHDSKPLKDVHTLSDRKTDGIPFSLLHRPKPIIRTNPIKIQEKYTKPSDLHREQAQKTRPRVVMTPAVSMDDIDNPKARELLCDDMYTSDMTRGLREAVFPYLSVRAPLTGFSAPSNPIFLPKLQPSYVAPEWRMQTVSWDNAQLRAYCNPTEDFWLAQEHKYVFEHSHLSLTNDVARNGNTVKINSGSHKKCWNTDSCDRCRACDESTTIQAHRRKLCQVNTGKN